MVARAPARTREPLLPREVLWLAIAMPPILYLLLDPEALRQPLGTVLRSIANIVIYTAACSILTHALFEIVAPRVHERVGAIARVFLYGTMLAIGVTAMTYAIAPVLMSVCSGMGESAGRLAVQGVVITWLYTAVGFIMRSVRGRLAEARERAITERAAALDARLHALSARTNPHFLFNSLNAGISLIATDPEGAEALFTRLSSLFRYTLEGSARRLVALEEELAAVRDYLAIEGVRFGERLRWKIVADPSLGSLRVPPMSLQPLAENAVLHGVGPHVAGGSVAVRARREGDRLLLEVEDDGKGPGGSTHRGSGTALADLRERLSIVYGSQAGLETGARAEGGFRAVIRIPIS